MPDRERLGFVNSRPYDPGVLVPLGPKELRRPARPGLGHKCFLQHIQASSILGA